MTTYFGAQNWKPALLRDLVYLQRGFDITRAQQKDGDVPVISSSGPTSWHTEAMAKAPGVVIGRKGSLGTVHYADKDYWPHDTTLWSKSLNGNDARFVYYALKCLKLERFNVGGANPTLNRNHIHDLPIRLPDLCTQHRIAGILSAYDDLIRNNQRRITLLEESAKILFREWFVDLRFPGHEHLNLVGGLPDGWERRPLVAISYVVMGQSPESRFYNDSGNGLPLHQGVTDYGLRFVTNRTYTSAFTRVADPGDILISVRAPVGRINITLGKIALGRGLAAVRSKNGNQSFLFYSLKNHFYAEDSIGNTGAIFSSINKKELEEQIIVEPAAPVLREFEEFASVVDAQIACLSKCNDKLVQARDFILPRLMNGEIAV